MNALPGKLVAAWRAARRRRGAIVAVASLLAITLLAAIGWRIGSTIGALFAAIVGIVVAMAVAAHWLRQLDATRVARRLDAQRRDVDDSSALLFADGATLTGLQRLQRQRLRQRVDDGPDIDLREPWPTRALALAGGASFVLTAATLLIDRVPSIGDITGTGAVTDTTAATATLKRISLAIEAPAYTGIAPTATTTLDGKAPRGSLLRWRLQVAPRPDSVTLAFHDGSAMKLVRDGDDWIGERRLDASVLYRVVTTVLPLDDGRLHRLDAIADSSPEVRVIEPERSLTLLASGQTQWPLKFEARDDHGLAGAALTITLAQGTGENVTFKEQTLTLDGTPLSDDPALATRARRYETTLDLPALGIAQGDDVIVRLAVGDNAEPTPNTTRSASFILRWPAPAASDGSGIEGMVQDHLPAYFRSQRQIIIDTEALIADLPSIDEETALRRSDTIGVDQRLLRLRYGQFLGEEAESGLQGPPPGSDDNDHADDDGHDHDKDHDGDGDSAGSNSGDDKARKAKADALAGDHDHGNAGATKRFGDAGAVVAEFGHVHDHAEAATLLDPETRRLLKAALDEMWQAELHLRQVEPTKALPYEQRALGFIKEVQQASRIYLARVGLELPELDETRRLTGKRDDVDNRTDALLPASPDRAIVASAWKAIDDAANAGQPIAAADLQPLENWLRERETALPDALGVIAAIDTLVRDPDCNDCRQQLRNLLWPLLPTPAAHSAPRPRDDAAAEAWRDALSRRTPRGANP